MSTTTSQERRQVASGALAAFGKQRSEHQPLSVQCAHSHHLAAVYETTEGLVYRVGHTARRAASIAAPPRCDIRPSVTGCSALPSRLLTKANESPVPGSAQAPEPPNP